MLRLSATIIPMESTGDYVEGTICRTDDIQDNEMKVFDLENAGKVLLVKKDGQLTALGHKCPHYGAPLDKAALGEGRIRCQWHGACFNIMTGDIEDFPGLDSLPCYQVNVDGDEVKVRAKRSELESNRRQRLMYKKQEHSTQKIIVIGGGPSAATCVENLRQEGFTGTITMICKEKSLPYDRVKLSKVLDMDIEKLQLRSTVFYEKSGIDVLTGVEVTAIDICGKNVILSTGEKKTFSLLYIATGCKPRKINIPGAGLNNICTLRGFEDAHYISSQLNKEVEVVILGASFIGMEAAAYCADKVKKVTIVAKDDVPFQNSFGDQIGKRLMDLYEEKGVYFIMNSGVRECVGEESKLTNVILSDNTSIKADILILGVGSTFNTEFFKNTSVELNEDGSVSVDEYLETNIKGIFVGGDIAKAPVHILDNEKVAIGHYGLAQYHGKIAALNMLGKRTSLKSVPYFFTMLFGRGIRYSGYGKYDDVKIYGALDELRFLAYYYKKDTVIAMASCARDPVVSQFAELLAQGKPITRSDVESGKLPWSNE